MHSTSFNGESTFISCDARCGSCCSAPTLVCKLPYSLSTFSWSFTVGYSAFIIVCRRTAGNFQSRFKMWWVTLSRVKRSNRNSPKRTVQKSSLANSSQSNWRLTSTGTSPLRRDPPCTIPTLPWCAATSLNPSVAPRTACNTWRKWTLRRSLEWTSRLSQEPGPAQWL